MLRSSFYNNCSSCACVNPRAPQVIVVVTDRHELHVIDPFPIRVLEIQDVSSLNLVYHELFYSPLTNMPAMSFCNSILVTGDYKDDAELIGICRNLHEGPNRIQPKHHFFGRQSVEIIDENDDPFTPLV